MVQLSNAVIERLYNLLKTYTGDTATYDTRVALLAVLVELSKTNKIVEKGLKAGYWPPPNITSQTQISIVKKFEG